jgi:hypothetical protein
MKVYRGMSVRKWNDTRVINDETNYGYLELVTSLRNIWLSCFHHQEQLVTGGLCAVHALPRSRLYVWSNVIPVLLAAYSYIEDNTPQASI